MGSSGGSGEHFLRHLSPSDGGAASELPRQECGGSRRWSRKKAPKRRGHHRRGGFRRTEEEYEQQQAGRKKRVVVVVVDPSSGARHAVTWALTHVASKGDALTLLRVLPPTTARGRRADDDASAALADSLVSLCKACKPEVEVESVVIRGPKLSTVLSQVKKLEASVLVLSQPKRSPFCCFMRSSGEEFVEECISRAECLTMAVRRQSSGVGGYLVSTRWQKNFWLLA